MGFVCGRKIKNKINAYIYSKRGINRCVDILYCNLSAICKHNCGCENCRNKKMKKNEKKGCN